MPPGAGQAHKLAPVRSRPHLIVLLSAWLMATGMHWDALQVFAWSRMFAANVRTLPVVAALRQTFDPQEMCGMCCSVQQAKREQRQEVGAGQGSGKAPLVIQPVASVIVAPPGARPLPADRSEGSGTERASPPVPPPRGVDASETVA